MTLDEDLRSAVEAERLRLCGDLAQVRSRGGDYGDYLGGYLSRPHLAHLVSEQLQEREETARWDASSFRKMLAGDRGVPAEGAERQAILETLDEVFQRCYAVARENGRLAGERPREFLDFLGHKPIAAPFREFGFDTRVAGFYKILDWNSRRRYQEAREDRIELTPKELLRSQEWVQPEVLESYLERERLFHRGSIMPTLVGYSDDPQQVRNHVLGLKMTESQYYKYLAISRCLRERPELLEPVIKRLENVESPDGGLPGVIATSPHSSVGINVTVMSRQGTVMLIRRSGYSRAWPLLLQVGPHETMQMTRDGAVESPFDLARRALQEDAGLDDPRDYFDEIVFSWFGLHIIDASAYFFAHVATRLTESEIAERVSSAESTFEVEDVEWMTPSRPNITAVLDQWSSGPWAPNPRNAQSFVPHATVSLTQLHRILRQGMLRVK